MAYRLAYVVFAYFVLAYLIGFLDWKMGGPRALALLAIALSVPLLLRVEYSLEGVAKTQALRMVLIAGVVVSLLGHTWYFTRSVQKPSIPMIDIGYTTLSAVRAVAHGKNPYSESIDRKSHWIKNGKKYDGYKYLPMTIYAYAPLSYGFGAHGLVSTNYILYLIQLLLLFELGRRTAASFHIETGLFAVLLCLCVSFSARELFVLGIIDIVSSLLGLVSLYLLSFRKKENLLVLLSGLAAGLSVSAKLMPGALFAIFCFPKERRLLYVIGGFIGLLPIIPHLLGDPTNFYTNIIEFNMLRPVDSTAWHEGVLPIWRTLAKIISVLVLLGAGLWVLFKNPDVLTRCALLVVSLIAVLLVAPVNHRNYQLWWLPIYGVLVASMLPVILSLKGQDENNSTN